MAQKNEEKRTPDHAYRTANGEKINEKRRQKYAANLEESRAVERERSRRKRQDPAFRARANAATRRWLAENREHFNDYRNARNATPQGKVETSIRNATKRILGLGGAKPDTSLKLLGCTVEKAVSHIESLFVEGMSWDNYGEWEIDHIRPLASFDLSDPKQARAAAHYTNLQPLGFSENRAKGARYSSAD